MSNNIRKDGKYTYLEEGEGQPIVLLHGLMGGLSNFTNTVAYFSKRGYKVILPELPIYHMPLLRTNVKSFVKYIYRFIKHKGLEDYVLLGNSLGGHIALLYAKMYPIDVKALVITGSSGLYENALGDSYPQRRNYEYVREKTAFVFYDPAMATQELVDEMYETVNNRIKLIKILAMAKSAIRHNMTKDLPKIKMPVAVIWGKNDAVTPPEVAEEFHQLLPNSSLYWIDKCGHAPMMERPDDFNVILEQWLKTV